ncbi:choice-of-anchor L domain-containing protein [Sabulilitoribacter multivorans]|uniref:Choice-of-anchor L domain-containing protein n=1 Tax=Flaviramulus multivorans TaxID=1304750 RepID=A0ABS9IME5_9FLAO|nr:choice-of-anchor L domain-containing protein [Flaviramulus multivorans]MCF7561779.1 choice-of-anchor L domain-containing protein [Flaviramulus multivorans]
MKHFIYFCLLFCFCFQSFAQNVLVDSQTYTPQQLIEDILINSVCIENVVVTNVVGGNFGGTDQSYGYFDASGTTFPFQRGIVLSTGRLSNVEGPNNSLSDDDAANWNGDSDLENILNETNTLNATIIEFEFTSLANQISFKYIFASEEYQENNPNTCQYSDLFGFLIRNVNNSQYTNIALIPNTQTPVKVTTVHPTIPNGCAAQNETYFGSWNNTSAPINFNGQTTVLTATANTIPSETYHVKLVIADEQNYRYDSAVFLEAGSFQLSTSLGPHRLTSTNNPLCGNETLTLDAFQTGNNTYRWFKDNVEILGETNATYTVVDAGTYNVEVSLENSCISYGEIVIEYTQNPTVTNTNIVECDPNQDGLTTYNLFDAEQNITGTNTSLFIEGFYTTLIDAQQKTNPINTPESYQNTLPQQIIHARVENQYGCASVVEITLDISNENINIAPYETCDDDIVDGFTSFSISDLTTHVEQYIPNGLTITCYLTEADAFSDSNILSGSYTNTTPNSETIYVKTESNGTCYAIGTLGLNIITTPELLSDNTVYYCLNTYPQTIVLDAGILNDSISNYTYEWFLNNQLLTNNTSSIGVNETGSYTAVVTHFNGCASSRNITVIPSNRATIESVDIQQASSNNTVTITVSGEGDYQFALDTPIFNDSNVFTNVTAGFHTIMVLDKNGCGITEKEIGVLGFPKFFTPNNDGLHDIWKPYGVNEQFNSNITINIFDRFGKLLKSINPIETGWDGTYSGNLLTNDDYWYTATFPDGISYKGHFTLKR